MKRVVTILAGVCLVCAAAWAADTVVEEIVARINGAIITRSDFQRSRDAMLQEVKEKIGDGADAKAEIAKREKDVLRDLIDQQLLLQKGQELGITADTELIKRLDEMRKSMNLDSMEALEKAAAAQGVSYEDYKQNLRNQIITQQVIQRDVGSRVQITPEEVKKFYDEHQKEMERPETVRLSEILISTQAKPAKEGEPAPEVTQADIDAAQKKAEEVVAELKKGAKFEDVAKKYSDGPTASQGGDLGEFKRGMLAKQLEDQTFAMKTGDTSGVVRTKQGFVILKVTQHTSAGIPPMKEVEPSIQEAIYYKKLQPALREYLTKLREEAFIDIKQGYVDSAASPNETKPVYTSAEVEGAKSKLKRKKKLGIF